MPIFSLLSFVKNVLREIYVHLAHLIVAINTKVVFSQSEDKTKDKAFIVFFLLKLPAFHVHDDVCGMLG